MTLDDLPFDYPSPATPNGAKGKPRCRQHTYRLLSIDRAAIRGDPDTFHLGGCVRCDKPYSPAASRRSKSSVRLGKDQERRIERVYGPRKVGEYGDAVDHLGRDFKWQAKATRSDPPKWLAAITEPTWRPIVPKSILDPMAHMSGIGGMRRPLVIRSYVHHGVATRDWLFVVGVDWFRLYGTGSIRGFGGFVIPGGAFGYVVMPGSAFLDLHGPDAP